MVRETTYRYWVVEKQAAYPYILTESHEVKEDGEVVGAGNAPIAKFCNKKVAEKVGMWLLAETDKDDGDDA